jgi:hypothetical protein
MNPQKLITRFILAMTVLIIVGGIWQPATAKSGVYRLHEGETIGLGMQGLHVSNIPRGVPQVYLDAVGMAVPARFCHKWRASVRWSMCTLTSAGLNETFG